MSFCRSAVYRDMYETTLSRDGTRIAFDRYGHGSPIITVVGAFNERPTAAPLAEWLADKGFLVVTYDRRGRGDSGDTSPYAVQREIEDLGALIEAVGGTAGVFGFSSGAILSVQAVTQGLAISRLALYDAPYLVDTRGVDRTQPLAELIAADRRGDAVEYFQRELVGIPPEIVAQFRHAPFRPGLERIAHTLVYEAMIVSDGALPAADVAARATSPTLAIAGGAGSPIMPRAAQAIEQLLPNARAHILPELGHDLVPAALGPVLAEFFGGSQVAGASTSPGSYTGRR